MLKEFINNLEPKERRETFKALMEIFQYSQKEEELIFMDEIIGIIMYKNFCDLTKEQKQQLCDLLEEYLDIGYIFTRAFGEENYEYFFEKIKPAIINS